MQMAELSRLRDLPDERGHFGPYGGVFVAETLISALDELKTQYARYRDDPEFVAEFERELKHYVGRPSPVYHARALVARARRRADLAEARGPQPHRRAQDQQLHRPGAAREALGKRRVIAETGAGQHGVATATVAARFGMECVVYMGSEDVARQAQNVYRMNLLGATVVPVESGSKTLKDALNEAMRDWVTNVDTTFYIIGTVAGPHPYPMLVRDFLAMTAVAASAAAQDYSHGPPPVPGEGRLPVLPRLGRRRRRWRPVAGRRRQSAQEPARPRQLDHRHSLRHPRHRHAALRGGRL